MAYLYARRFQTPVTPLILDLRSVRATLPSASAMSLTRREADLISPPPPLSGAVSPAVRGDPFPHAVCGHLPDRPILPPPPGLHLSLVPARSARVARPPVPAFASADGDGAAVQDDPHGGREHKLPDRWTGQQDVWHGRQVLRGRTRVSSRRPNRTTGERRGWVRERMRADGSVSG